ncbi:MAG: hypothetical protein J5644_10540 [Bacteroidales bacterium]|nr:hypothetical protein [Bacteroidales bacterium]
MKRKVIIFLLAALVCGSVSAQQRKDAAPYYNGIGGTLGFMNGVTFKTFPTNHFAIQLDLGYRFIADYRTGAIPLVFTFNPNFMYEGACGNGFYWFIGGGLNIGGSLGRYYRDAPHRNEYYRYGNFVLGANLIGGAEYKFANIPLALQVDARPGMFVFMNHRQHDPYLLFDYNFFNVSARYTF